MARSKYGNRKVRAEGYVFDSIMEYERYKELKLLVKAGEISRLEVHPRYCLQESFVDADGVRWPAIHYSPDFQYVDADSGMLTAEDVKGAVTAVFSLKEKLFRRRYLNIKFKVLRV